MFIYRPTTEKSRTARSDLNAEGCLAYTRAGFKCVEALGKAIIRGPYPPLKASNAIIYMHLQL